MDHNHKKSQRLALILVGVVGIMVGLAFASVPLYRLFCQVTGFGGTPQTVTATSDQVYDREITIRLDANTDPDLPWAFKPVKSTQVARVGENLISHYTAKNLSDQALTGMALYNVTPEKAGAYFHKVQCFCFDQQTLQAGQEMDMPVLFYLDPELLDDKDMDGVDEITLSYTFFAAEPEE